MKHLKFGFGIVILALLVAAPVAFAQSVTVQVADDAVLGKFLTDGQGMTLYMFAKDTPNVSNCYDQCAVNWPPLLVGEGEAPSAGAGVTGQLGVIERTDGTRQVTYNDMPLYYFAGDSKPGDTNGHNVKGVWFVVHPDAPSVTVSDQAIVNGTVTIDRVVTAEPGWLVIHAEADGKPGPILGQSAVQPGENLNVVVTIDESKATPKLFAMLHVDRGTRGTFEFPGGDDVPVTLGGAVVTPPFQVVESAPASLPVAGGSPAPSPWPILLVAIGGLALLGGLSLSFARSRR